MKKKPHKPLTQARLKSVLSYDESIGIFLWRSPNNQTCKTRVAGTKHHTKKSKTAYIRIKIDGWSYLAQRLAFLYKLGRWPRHQADHWNTDTLDNRWINLREATQSQNQGNATRRTDNKTGHKGVAYNMRDRMYYATIQVDGVGHHLGCFKKIEPAIAIYAKSAREFFGEFARVA